MVKSGENQKSCLNTRWRPQGLAKLECQDLVFTFHWYTEELQGSKLVEYVISSEWHCQSLWFKFQRNSDENSWIYSKWWVLSKLSTNAGYSVFWAYPEKFILVFLFGNSIWNAPWPAKPQHNILFFLSFGFIHISDCTMNCSKMQKTVKPFSLIGCAQ